MHSGIAKRKIYPAGFLGNTLGEVTSLVTKVVKIAVVKDNTIMLYSVECIMYSRMQ